VIQCAAKVIKEYLQGNHQALLNKFHLNIKKAINLILFILYLVKFNCVQFNFEQLNKK